jgi:hypothetical protein
MRNFIALGCCLLLLTPAFGQVEQPEGGLKVVVREGEGAVNNIRQLRAKEPVIEVQDANGQPLKGVAVSFVLPDLGASGVFSNGASSLALLTDEKGLAVGRGLRPNNVVGQYEIRVVASYQGQTGRAVISQTNAAPAGSGSSGGGGKKAAIVLLIVGGAAAGAAVGLTQRKSSSTAAAPSSTTISPGGTTIGPPR